MKKVNFITILAVAAASFLFTACSESEQIEESMALADKSLEMNSTPGDSCTFEDELTEADISGLVLMREEEKLAHDVYLKFYELYGQAIFENIAKSEAAHTNAVLNLLNGYGIEDPALEVAGEFSNEEFAALYAALIEAGSVGLVEALTVGATIEDLDIFDLQELLKETSSADITGVYQNLLKGSENHMRAFVGALATQNATYEAQYITAAELAEILAAENENSKGTSANENDNGNKGNNQGNAAENGNDGNTPNEDCDSTGADEANGNQGSAQGNSNGNK
ncbi:DUF2202 domain-containing protein [uncultured Draconibacterium sp.]|uniref:DUF2202 domain-containing protein n=1 Tax=uncultured Draconibacterium sp. TaxID=1573823 RepID=UPI0025D237F7|nr:DUF2202 domain-containing protein [uncultured Draconibacterium sp.]